MSFFTKISSVVLHDFTSGKSRHSVLAPLLCWFGVVLVIEK